MKVLSAILLTALSGVAAAQPGAQPAQPLAPPPTGSSATPATPSAPDPNRPTTSSGAEILTLQRAVEIAIQQQPTLRQSRADLEAARGRIDLAKVARNPVLALSAQAGTQSGQTFDKNEIPAGNFNTHIEFANLRAQANWTIYDFGQTSANIRAAELNAEATAATVGTTTLDIRTNVEVTFLEAVARRKLVLVAETTVKSEDGHLDQAKRFVAAGAKDPIEVAQAQSRFANARSALAQAQSNEAIALANLRSAIGWLSPERAPVVSADWPTPSDADPDALDQLVTTARKQRPELAQLDLQIQAADATLDAAHAERRPTLSAAGDILWTPRTGNTEPDPSWAASLTLSWNLWDGGRAAADSRIANANLASAAAQRDGLLVTLTSQIDSARSQIVANRENVRASTEAVAAARSELQLAEARYAQGLGSQIELTDAQTAVTTAEGNLVTAEWQLATAWAQLHRAVAIDISKVESTR
ncbi:MAG TPA: TolC family protein [Kofleriaceae bacterium]|nr:TolC family protein [Kofleriaceae bacterium]